MFVRMTVRPTDLMAGLNLDMNPEQPIRRFWDRMPLGAQQT
jgi:hypothetical protein